MNGWIVLYRYVNVMSGSELAGLFSVYCKSSLRGIILHKECSRINIIKKLSFSTRRVKILFNIEENVTELNCIISTFNAGPIPCPTFHLHPIQKNLFITTAFVP